MALHCPSQVAIRLAWRIAILFSLLFTTPNVETEALDAFAADDLEGKLFYHAQLEHASRLIACDRLILDDCLARVEADTAAHSHAATPGIEINRAMANLQIEFPTSPPRKKSNQRNAKGDGTLQIESWLLKHHLYRNNGCGNYDPIKANELAAKARVGKATVSDFFQKVFGSYKSYAQACRNEAELTVKLKIMAKDYSELHTYGRTPPDEGRVSEE